MHRTRGPSRLVVVLAVVAGALIAAGCGEDEAEIDASRGPGAAASWERLPAGPLSPRESALALWTGDEVLVVGGSDAPPCPPTAGCVPPDEPPLADGAAFDPEQRAWRPIATSPVPFERAEGVVVGRTAYLWIPGNPARPEADRAFLAYRVDSDRWEELSPPPVETDFARFVTAGRRMVVYGGSDEQGEGPDLIFDPASGAWSELPADPLSPSFDRSMAWSGEELVLFDHELVPNPGSEEPAVTRAAALDLETGSWRRLPDSQILGTGPWVLDDGGRLVNPTLGGADGGEVNGWGRTYPYGGVLDLRRDRWEPLPEGPGGQEAFAGGVLTGAGATFFGSEGWLLDARAGEWIQIPPPEGRGSLTGESVVAAGRDLFVFGGARSSAGGRSAELVADAAIWGVP